VWREEREGRERESVSKGGVEVERERERKEREKKATAAAGEKGDARPPRPSKHTHPVLPGARPDLDDPARPEIPLVGPPVPGRVLERFLHALAGDAHAVLGPPAEALGQFEDLVAAHGDKVRARGLS